jgi:hypothetical protein
LQVLNWRSGSFELVAVAAPVLSYSDLRSCVVYSEQLLPRGGPPSEHAIQLFDDIESRADRIAEFVRDGVLAGDPVLLVITPLHGQAVMSRCRSDGVDVDTAIDAGWLTVFDAADMLTKFVRNDRPDPALFLQSIGSVVHGLASRGSRLRIYGEMVDVLARLGEFRAAQALEELWNDLAARHSFTLFCGYSAEHFGNPRYAESLRRICALHSHVRCDSRDILGSFLVKGRIAS